MSNTFKYSVLRYRPSYLLDEQVNIGLLFSFPQESSLTFIYPDHLQRLKGIYPDADLTFIRRYLAGFESKANKLSSSSTITDLSTELLAREFLVFDSNSFYFTEIKRGQYFSKEDILAYYKGRFFGVYDPKSLNSQFDDSLLVKHFSDRLFQLKSNHPKVRLIRKKIEIKNPISTTTFDYGWKNGSINLVKALSFDLKLKDSIQNKSFRWFGELSNLNEIAQKEGYKFDILVAPPSSPKLEEPYRNAIEVLKSIRDSNQIIEKAKISDYLDSVLESIQPLEGLGEAIKT